MGEALIFERSVPGRSCDYFPVSCSDLSLCREVIAREFLRDELPLPSLGELDVVRHYVNLSRSNFSVDSHFYPLGSCTMKYNPKISEELSSLEGFTMVHPYQNQKDIQGALEVMYNLERALCALTGMSRFTFQPAAGAHGELTGMLMIRAFHSRQAHRRGKVIIPDSAHGTNPATARMCGYNVCVVKSTSDGLLDIDELNRLIDDETAAVMMTNPNTLGLFEERILDIQDIVHRNGALLYYDGANFNPLLGIVRPAAMGFDVLHLNLHKTFATPHGSGGPGAGVVGVRETLEPFLPVPLVSKQDGSFYFDFDRPHTIGKVKGFYGNFIVLLKAYIYILRLGGDGLKQVAQNSVLAANYIRQRLKEYYEVCSSKQSMHEVVFSCIRQKERGVSALDIAKRLIDCGIHPPTMYFPLIVREALMVEPTETESKETLDLFIRRMREIDEETKVNPGKFADLPSAAPVARVDEVTAARFPDIRWKKNGA